MAAVQCGPTSIAVTWNPSSNATGYKIYFESNANYSDSETVSGGSDHNHTLTGLLNGQSYTISIIAIFFSEKVTLDKKVNLGM